MSVVITQSSVLSQFPDLKHGISTRIGGASSGLFGFNTSFSVGDRKEHVEENRRRFYSSLGVDARQIAAPRQQHTSNIQTAIHPGAYEACDALITDLGGMCLTVSVADCAPILLYDPNKRAIGCVHAGWRGTQKRILFEAVERMKSEFGSAPADMLAFAGPCAGPCCYEVGEEVAELFDGVFRSRRNGKTYLDIKKANAAQLKSAGIPDANVEILSDCTICGTEFYHSFRRDREQSGRMMALIGMTE